MSVRGTDDEKTDSVVSVGWRHHVAKVSVSGTGDQKTDSVVSVGWRHHAA